MTKSEHFYRSKKMKKHQKVSKEHAGFNLVANKRPLFSYSKNLINYSDSGFELVPF